MALDAIENRDYQSILRYADNYKLKIGIRKILVLRDQIFS